MTARRAISRADLVPVQTYAATRTERRRALLPRKRLRRVSVGPYATFFFECFDSMLLQIQEMLHIEQGGEDQIADELAAYNPMIPNGRELTATLMFEIGDEALRRRILAELGGIEDNIALTIGDSRIAAVPEGDVERTNAAGKTSAVHFLHFPFTAAQIAAFRDPSQPAVLGFGHPRYLHMAGLSAETRAELAVDFD